MTDAYYVANKLADKLLTPGELVSTNEFIDALASAFKLGQIMGLSKGDGSLMEIIKDLHARKETKDQ